MAPSIERPRYVKYQNFSSFVCIKWLKNKDNTPVIEYFATIVLAIVALISIIFSILNLQQQKREETIQYRAYVSIIGVQFESNQQEKEGFLRFTIKNGGITPAERLIVTTYALLDGTTTVKAEESGGFLQPGQSGDYLKKVSIDELDLIKEGGENLFVIEIDFEDYARDSHKFVGKFTSAQLDGVYKLIVKSEEEIY